VTDYDSEIELSEQQCPNCDHDAYRRRCGCDNGLSYHDCGEDSVCLNAKCTPRDPAMCK